MPLGADVGEIACGCQPTGGCLRNLHDGVFIRVDKGTTCLDDLSILDGVQVPDNSLCHQFQIPSGCAGFRRAVCFQNFFTVLVEADIKLIQGNIGGLIKVHDDCLTLVDLHLKLTCIADCTRILVCINIDRCISRIAAGVQNHNAIRARIKIIVARLLLQHFGLVLDMIDHRIDYIICNILRLHDLNLDIVLILISFQSALAVHKKLCGGAKAVADLNLAGISGAVRNGSIHLFFALHVAIKAILCLIRRVNGTFPQLRTLKAEVNEVCGIEIAAVVAFAHQVGFQCIVALEVIRSHIGLCMSLLVVAIGYDTEVDCLSEYGLEVRLCHSIDFSQRKVADNSRVAVCGGRSLAVVSELKDGAVLLRYKAALQIIGTLDHVGDSFAVLPLDQVAGEAHLVTADVLINRRTVALEPGAVFLLRLYMEHKRVTGLAGNLFGMVGVLGIIVLYVRYHIQIIRFCYIVLQRDGNIVGGAVFIQNQKSIVRAELRFVDC